MQLDLLILECSVCQIQKGLNVAALTVCSTTIRYRRTEKVL